MAINVPIVSSWDGKGVSKAVRDFKKLEGGSSKAAFGLLNADAAARKGVATLAKFGVIAGGVGVALAGKFALAGERMATANARISQVNKSMGLFGVQAEKVSQRIIALSEATARQTGVDQNSIKTTAAKLLTFKNLAATADQVGGAFDRALLAAVDLAATGFGEATSNATQLGKALQDPVKGLTALGRAGVTFTAQEKEKIKALVESGRMLEAQNTLLAAVESQVKGVASATANESDKMRVAFSIITEQIGTLLLPTLQKLSSWVNTSVIPTLETFRNLVGERGLGAGFEFLAGKIIGAVWNMGALGKTLTVVLGAFAALRVATITYTAVQGALQVAAALTSNALKAQAIQAAATKTAMLAAGGLTAIVAAAGIAYSVYAKRKAEAVQRTKDFVSALQLEGDEQKNAIDNLYKTDKTTRGHIDTLVAMGLTIDDLSRYVENGSGGVADLAKKWKIADASAKGIYPSLQAFADALGISTENGYHEIAAVRNMVQAFEELRNEQKKQLEIQIGLAKARKDFALATQLEQQLYGVDISIRGAVKQATEEQTTTQEDLNVSLDKQAKAVKTAQERFKEYVTALKGYGADQKSYTSAIKDTTSAKKKLEEATNKVSVAQARYDQIVRGYGAGSDQAKAAQEALDQAQRDATRASFDSEKATFAVTDAEKELADLRASQESTPQQIREAEIALAEAKLSQTEQTLALRDANQAVADAQAYLNEVINGATPASQTYKDALQELNDAKADEADAANNVADAIDRETEAKLRLADAERELDAARKGTTAKQRATAESRTGVDDKTVSGKRREFLDMVNKQFGEKWKSINAYINAGKTATSKANRKARFNEFARANSIPEMAKGGIVSTPTLALIGEKAPEAVVPLDRLAPSGGDTYNITINSKIADETLPDLLVAELRKFNRRSGAINIQVA